MGDVSLILRRCAIAGLVLLLPGAVLAQNEIVTENALPGSPPAEWDIAGAGDFNIQGYATELSVDQGQTVHFKVRTDATDYRLDIYRLGYYNGDGARLVATVQPSATLPQVQPTCDFEPTAKLLDCGNWEVSASWNVPSTAVSGVYLAKLVREDATPGTSHIAFVVRDDDGASELLFQTSDTTWQAYNRWGEGGATAGYSLYEGPDGKASKVSYNRPFGTREYPTEDWVFNAEYPMIRWLERNGYDVSYCTGIDTDRLGAGIQNHDVFVSVGHDEYWSRDMRQNVTAARDAGTNLAFFSGNEVYWKIRWEPSIDGSATPRRTLVCYKEGTLGENQCGTKCDPLTDVWTGLWRSGCEWPLADGCEPENSLTGQISWMGTTRAMAVPAAYGQLPFWRNTSIAGLTAGQSATLPDGTLGYEWDFEQYAATYPARRIRMSETLADGQTHNLSLYQAPSGARVFGAGTVQWSWGLDSVHDRGNGAPSTDMQQATVNLFADMGVQPMTLQAGLTPTAALADADLPVSAISFPVGGETFEVGATVTVQGTASDTGGAGVALVEVSTDGGLTWQPADGLATWSFNYTPTAAGAVTIQSRAMDAEFNLEVPGAGVAVTIEPRACPCTLWSDATLPGIASIGGSQPVELGMKFRSDTDGYITAIRFYKGTANTGTHTGHLWDAATGTLLGTTIFAGETADGWQESPLEPAVPITANTTYIVSYFSPNGQYAFDAGYFASGGVDNPPLRALADGEDGPNGVYLYSPTGGFPTATYNASNYWVDVRYHTTAVDESAPTVVQRTPAASSLGVAIGTMVTATFNEPVNPATVDLQLVDEFFAPVAGTVTYDAPTRTVTFDPASDLQYSTEYNASLAPATDLAGNAMATGVAWSFTTRDLPPPPPDEGPGGPILVIGTATNPFTRYPAEILRAEGLNSFTATDISAVDATLLAAHDVVVLGEMSLSPAQVTMFADWVTAGGNLIALRPDKQLAGLLGLADAATTLSEGYLLVDTASGPGAGIVGQTMQFHGTADAYTLAGATALATLYGDATTATAHPAVSLVSVGSNGGQAAAFTYDLARSVVYTRQGNPLWEGQDRDGRPPLRANDMFFGAAAGDPQPDWVNLDKVAIPQADEQQRLLANLILQMNADRLPLPRFWYFPRGLKAAVVMTGDEHNTGAGSVGRFAIYQAADPVDCSLADWECVRASTYLYPGTGMSDAQALAFTNAGFEVGLHVNTGCTDWTPAQLENYYATQLASLAGFMPSIPAPSSERTHCISWADWASQAAVKLQHGIRLDTNYYFWPPEWVLNRPGMYTGSGMPMRFADLDGSMIDVYQVTTQMTDESSQSFPYTMDTLLDRALGSEGYYGAFCANMHNDATTSAAASAIIASAQARGVPVISGRQLLTWLDARNASSFDDLAWTGNTLTFGITTTANARNLEGMLPLQTGAASLVALARDGGGVSFRTETIKGVAYAIFTAEAGSYQADYDIDIVPPVIAGLTATPHGDGTATVSWTTTEPSTSQVDFGIDALILGTQVGSPALVTSHAVTLTGLTAETTYYFRATSVDAAANSATEPVAGNPAASFTTPAAPEAPCLLATTAADFAGGSSDGGIMVAEAEGGELILAPTEGTNFDGTALPAGWGSGIWNTGGSATVGGGQLEVDAAYASTTNAYSPGRVVEFMATFTAAPGQHAGIGVNLNNDTNWAIFSTFNDGANLYARTNNTDNHLLGPALLGSAHLYRIEWTPAGVTYFVDGNQVHTTALSATVPMRPIASDLFAGGLNLSIDWLRMTPYAATGSYESAVHGTGAPTDWQQVAWTGVTPAGTSIDVSVRTGGVAIPDGTWSVWVPVASGAPLGLNSPFIQYRVELASGDPLLTPVVKDVGIWCEEGIDTSPPVISALTALPGAEGTTALITWTTSEPADSRVDYGSEAGLLDLNVSDGTLVVSHSVALSGLLPGRTYYFRATSADAATNSATEPLGAPAEFHTPEQPCAVVTSVADFDGGTLSGTYVSQSGDGSLMLAPAAGSEFFGTALPADWTQFPWSGGAVATVGGGQLSADGVFAGTSATYPQGQVLEFVATFTADAYQHIGFAVDFSNGTDWAMFSTGNQNTNLLARTNVGGTTQDVVLGAGLLGSPHLFRIEWLGTGVEFYIDGAGPLHTSTLSPAQAMRPMASDYTVNGLAASVDWMHLRPYAASGTWLSPVFDAGTDGAYWQDMVWTAIEPAGTSVDFSVRGGDTPAPDGTWTSWSAVSLSGTDLDLTGRYLQVEALLGTSDPAVSPLLEDFSVACGCCADAPNTIAFDAGAVGALTSIVPCATAVPVKITRTDATPVRGFSVTFGLSPELELCGDANSSILESTLLAGFGTGTQFVVTDNLDGTYTVDNVILDAPCGSTAAVDTLFTVDLAAAVAEGTGAVTILAVELRDCADQPLPVGAGPSAAIIIDTVAPLPVTDFGAAQALAGSGPGRTLVMTIGWTASTSPDAAAVAVYGKGFGSYPEYDDAGGTVPVLAPDATPADAELAGWTLVDLTVETLTADLQATRDVWSYTAFCLDQYGNPSPPAAVTTGLPNYILGDVSDGQVVEGEPLPGDGDNQLDTIDMSLLGSYYGMSIGADHVANRLDIGPLVGHPLLGRPATDNEIEFEDLILFGINYGRSGLLLKQEALKFAAPAPSNRNDLAVVVGTLPAVGEVFPVRLEMAGDGAIQALSVPLLWDARVVEPVAVQGGELLAAQGGTGLALSPVPGTVDIGLMGVRDRGISGQGVVATVTFRVLAAGDPAVGVGGIRARSAGNTVVELGSEVRTDSPTPSAMPVVTTLHAAAPNPFNPSTTLAYDMAVGGRVTLKIYSIDGRLVRTLVDEQALPGRYSRVWQGRDDAGRTVASGAYVVRMVAPDRTETRRVMLLK